MIAVFDTNVFIAAIITEGVCSKLLGRARAGEFLLASCPFIESEIRRILSGKFRLGKEEVALSMALVNEAVERVFDPACKVDNICRDADDDNILACALAAKAGHLVTGDAGLLEIKSFRGVKIAAPRDFELLFG
ncbi:MAG: putative toxin-antitoxin system toxin component, PIN family [Nitrospiraceae bacterium]|nr:putative toxin-antitoxin system toxin component, PIN family [Nitrospiraceae bacterium]